MVDHLVSTTGLSRKQSGDAVQAVLDVMESSLRAGKAVGLPGLGTFGVKETAARTGVRPGTSEKIAIPAGRKVSFKVAVSLKDALV